MEEDGWIPSAGVENEFDINKRNCVLCLVVSFLEVFTIRSMLLKRRTSYQISLLSDRQWYRMLFGSGNGASLERE